MRIKTGFTTSWGCEVTVRFHLCLSGDRSRLVSAALPRGAASLVPAAALACADHLLLLFVEHGNALAHLICGREKGASMGGGRGRGAQDVQRDGGARKGMDEEWERTNRSQRLGWLPCRR